ncbi:hypothetical protein F3Y22_tig00111095pilonHSYRG00630 [Hibiscus syriacus]|uniref:Uncharacterized protein n=1 Tax=Hibiscus syriacus TaxID=106335 RepID=A0A6A2Z1A3_HIBSY|nr:hypothetical protein F3Y22_tig00111095pilonHSYRG00630 [Hibiscus syriacus]
MISLCLGFEIFNSMGLVGSDGGAKESGACSTRAVDPTAIIGDNAGQK